MATRLFKMPIQILSKLLYSRFREKSNDVNLVTLLPYPYKMSKKDSIAKAWLNSSNSRHCCLHHSKPWHRNRLHTHRIKALPAKRTIAALYHKLCFLTWIIQSQLLGFLGAQKRDIQTPLIRNNCLLYNKNYHDYINLFLPYGLQWGKGGQGQCLLQTPTVITVMLLALLLPPWWIFQHQSLPSFSAYYIPSPPAPPNSLIRPFKIFPLLNCTGKKTHSKSHKHLAVI